ncbi:MAG: hypothetical protein U1E65_16650 [Myxococcota bacterium]
MRYHHLLTSLPALCGLIACGGEGPSDPGLDEATSQSIVFCSPSDPDCGAPPEGPRCPTVQEDAPAATSTYRCDAAMSDEYGRPLWGARVHLRSQWCGYFGTTDLGEVTGTLTRGSNLILSGSLPRGNRVNCWVETNNARNTSDGVGQTSPIVSASLTVRAVRTPEPTLTRNVTGLVAGDAQLDLYQSGDYDKILIIPEPFDPLENDAGQRRDRTRYWQMLKPLMVQLFGAGWDIWLFQPSNTGANLHEQAAEFAQAIQLAGRSYAGAPRCGGGEVAILGFNSGGLVARMATARWEQDSLWTSALGITGSLPVNALGTIDSPHFGWNMNADLQHELWSSWSADDLWLKTNLDSCAAAQLTRWRYDVLTGGFSNNSFNAFFSTGQSFNIRSHGVNVTCAGGPAVSRRDRAGNDASWPTSVRRFGFSNGTQTAPNRCYGTPDDFNAAGQNLCARISALGGAGHIPQVGDAFVEVSVANAPNTYWNVSADDLVPGSRNPSFLDGISGHKTVLGVPFIFELHQRFSPTYIPSKSADGTDSPTGPRPLPFAEFEYESSNRSADALGLPAVDLILRNLNAAGVCP